MSISEAWYEQHPLLYLLAPIAFLFQQTVKIRRSLYRKQWLRSVAFPLPIIVVGNINIGGTGKTPLVIWLAQLLKKHGYRPSIISRGYGNQLTQYPHWVTAASDATVVGDEAVLLATHTGCPMVVDSSKVRGVRYLLENSDTNVVLSDDGLQHYQLARDIEIAVVDGERRFGNGFCLPAGPLREPISRLAEVDFIVNNSGEAGALEYQMKLVPQLLHSVIDNNVQQPLTFLEGKEIHAVAGIGNPRRFFNMLQQLQLNFNEHVFPDHYQYHVDDINFSADAIVLMTEKDAVKCVSFADHRHWYLPVKAQVEPKLAENILRKVLMVSQQKRW